MRTVLVIGLAAALVVENACVWADQSVDIQDRPVRQFQTDLLDMAFDMATAMPIKPHVKDRSNAQEKVCVAALKLRQPSRVLRYAEQIANWRRGKVYADYAFYCAENGATNNVAKYLDSADQYARSAQQVWRHDLVRSRIAQTWLLLGREEKAEEVCASLVDSEAEPMDRLKAVSCTQEDFDAQLKALDGMILAGGIDLVRNAQYGYVNLFRDFHQDAARRARIEKKIKNGWKSLPYFDRIDLLALIANIALENGNKPDALRLCGEAEDIVESATWPPGFHARLTAKLAVLKFKSGEQAIAAEDLDRARAYYSAGKEKIVSIDRTETLLPIAEAYHAQGNAAEALKVYSLAVEEAVINPNSRPQAEDLSAICISMALKEVAPSEQLWNRIKALKESLGEPW